MEPKLIQSLLQEDHQILIETLKLVLKKTFYFL